MIPSLGVESPRVGNAAPYISAPVLGAIVLAQTTVMHRAMIGSTPPSLPLVAVISWGLLRGPVPALWWAVGLGLMLDVVSPQPAGFHSLPLVGVAAVGVLLGRRLFSTNLLLPLGLVAFGTALFSLFQYGLLAIEHRLDWAWRPWVDATLPLLVLNLAWLPAVYLALRWLARRLGAPAMGWER
ncbi:rod shape-determining protein MreD [bacterium]|nr:rod shape-determining protein MreD [Chloroflexi bacterium CFX6]RIL09981.1 MAG: rod shape-determining protein MreD [bacterium]